MAAIVAAVDACVAASTGCVAATAVCGNTVGTTADVVDRGAVPVEAVAGGPWRDAAACNTPDGALRRPAVSIVVPGSALPCLAPALCFELVSFVLARTTLGILLCAAP